MDYSAGLVKAAEETAARTVYRSDTGGDTDSPAFQCAAYKEELPDVTLMRDVFGGTKALREKGELYLPKHPMETEPKYKARLGISLSMNATKTTVEGLSGMIFRKDPTLEDVPEDITKHYENIDQRGNSLAVFLHGVADNALLDGHSWIHVETPRTVAEDAQTEEEEGIRPYWVNVLKKDNHNRRVEIRNGKPLLTLFAYQETHSEPDGEFGEAIKERIRIMREGALSSETGVRGNVRGEVWEKVEVEDQKTGKKEMKWRRIEEYEVAIMRIPVVFVPAERCGGAFRSKPPLLDLAYEQIEHRRVRSDRQKALTFTGVEVPYLFGKDVVDDTGKSKITWGNDGMLLVNDPEATAGVISPTGNGLTAMKEEIEAVTANMATLGLRMLQRDPGTQPTTATADILSKSEGNANLSTFATEMEVAANEAHAFHMELFSTEPAGKIKINRDFHEQMMDPQWVSVLGEQVAAKRLSLETMWAKLVQGEVLPADFDPKEERKRIEEDGAAGLHDLLTDPLLEAARQGGALPGQEDDEDPKKPPVKKPAEA